MANLARLPYIPAMPLLHSKGMPVGTSAPPFALPGVDGNIHSLQSFADAELLVVVFTCNHCPYAIACEDRLIALQSDYQDKGVQLVAINPNDAVGYPDDSFGKMKERAQAKGFNFPYLRDESQEVARAYDAVCTPDFFGFDANGKLQYRGRLDDARKGDAANRRPELLEAMRLIAATGRGPDEQHASMGCSIKWREA